LIASACGDRIALWNSKTKRLYKYIFNLNTDFRNVYGTKKGKIFFTCCEEIRKYVIKNK
jgi:hypothetical protein